MSSARQSRAELDAIYPRTRRDLSARAADYPRGRRLNVDDHDAAIALLAVFVVVRLALGLPTFVARGDVEVRALTLAPLFLLATTDLFDDPRFEHGDENL
jgi:hypothetical protein